MDTEITQYPDTPLRMFKVTFSMKKRGGDEYRTCTTVFPAVSREAVEDAVSNFALGISEASNNKLIFPKEPRLSIEEVDHVRVFAEGVK